MPLLARLPFPVSLEGQLVPVELHAQVASFPPPGYHQNTLLFGTAAGICASLNV